LCGFVYFFPFDSFPLLADVAAIFDQPAIVEYLIDNGANIELRGCSAATPLLNAAFEGLFPLRFAFAQA
jgi:hypothetical protein